MVGVPSALHLAAGLLAVAASAGLAVAILDGALAGPGPTRGRRDPARLIGAGGALVYALGHVLSGATLADPTITTWVQAAGLLGLAIGAGPTHPATTTLPLLVPITPTGPAHAAAAAAVLAALRIVGAGRSALPAAGGMVLLAAAHFTQPTRPTSSEGLFLAGALLLGAWLWSVARRRILTKLLAGFVSVLLALAILLSVLLSTVGTNQLTRDELARLTRVATGLVEEIEGWPAEAVSSATAIAIAPRPLLQVQLTPQEAADLYRVGFAEQDFFIVLDAAGQVVNRHPGDLGGSVELSIAGDSAVRAVRDGTGGIQEAGGLLSTGGRIIAYGAVALRPDDLLPEDPPAGVLITGRLVDPVWAEQEAAQLEVGIIGVVGGDPVFATSDVAADARAVADGLDGRTAVDLSVGGEVLFAAAAPVVDPDTGAPLGRILTTSTPAVIATLEETQAERLFLASLASGLLAVLVAALVIRRVVRPITELTDVARRIGQGDLSGRAGIRSPDEIGVLGATFDEMVASMQVQQGELSDAARTEARLRGRLESLTSSMSDGLVAVDPDGLVIQFNPAAEALTGLAAREVIGAPLEQVLADRIVVEGLAGTGTVRDPEGGRLLEAAAGDRPAAARLRLRRADGVPVPVAATAAPVRSPDGEVLGRVFVLRDISREMEVERMKTEFLANVSHELRTPITPIKGYANVLARRDVGADATRRFAGEILASTARLERIVGMIVDFAALDSGRVTMKPEPIDLTRVVADALAEWRVAHAGREFGNHLNGGLPPVLADPVYLRRVIDELLDNAVKFSPDGDPVDVTARVQGDRVRLSVVDRGIGIDPQAASQLFTDFRQIDGTETRHYGGLGLGLGLVKRILEGTGATAEVESDPGVGATFSLLLPVGGPVPPPPLPEPPARAGRVPPPPS